MSPLDLEQLAARLSRVCVRVCNTIVVDDDTVVPGTLTGQRFSAADCGETVSGAIVAALIAGRERGFLDVAFDVFSPVRTFGWIVRDADTEPLIGVVMSVIDTAPVPVFGSAPVRGIG